MLIFPITIFFDCSSKQPKENGGKLMWLQHVFKATGKAYIKLGSQPISDFQNLRSTTCRHPIIRIISNIGHWTTGWIQSL